MWKIKNSKGFTLLEVQIASLMMVVILIAVGVVFYFALSVTRYLNDAYETYYTASNCMKAITKEVMQANCYGFSTDPSWFGSGPMESFYGPGGIVTNSIQMPTLNGLLQTSSDPLCLRSAGQIVTFTGQNTDHPKLMDGHDNIYFFLRQEVIPAISPNPVSCLIMDKQIDGGSYNPGGGEIIGLNVTSLDLSKISYNCVGVVLRVTGTIPDPISGGLNIVEMRKAITLRSAPGQCAAPEANGSW